MPEYASNCPDANCPPGAATDVDGEVFRFVRHDPPVGKDFASYLDEDKNVADLCQGCALSVLTRREDIPIARAAMPWFKKRMVAEPVLHPEHGKITQTGLYKWHYSLWVRSAHGANVHSLFKVVAA